jgi:hypothetical protein
MKKHINTFIFLSIIMLSACSSNKKANDITEWKFTENIDQSKVVELDKDNGKMFTLLSGATTGVDFNNELKETFNLNYYRYGYSYNGAGVGIGDVNNDGLPDLYFAGNVVPDKLYINKGNMKFEDVSDKAGINTKPGWSGGVTLADVNEDGWMDIYVCRMRYEDPEKRRNLLYINNQDGTFTERAKEFGIDDDSYSTGANFFDADNDGDLDLYIVTHPTDFKDKNKQKNYQKIEDGSNMSNRFYRNDGGKFTECHKEVGINNHGFGLSVTAGDMNNDGWQDIFVGNDYIMHDYTYMNKGNGKFEEMSRDVLTKTAYYGMGTDLADINNDGLLEMFTVDMDIEGNYGTKTFMQSNKQTFLRTLVNAGYLQQYGRNALQLNNGMGKYSEIANLAGVSTTGWSWSPLFADYDNDGFKDLYVTNGFLKDSHMDVMEVYIKLTRANRLSDSSDYYELRKTLPENSVLQWPNAMFKNNGDLTFDDVREDWGLYYPTMTYGGAYADLDLDGDIDIVLNNANFNALICRNNSEKMSTNKYLRVQLKGESGNHQGIGAKIYATVNGTTQYIQMGTVKGYMSCSEAVAHFGLGQADKVEKLVVKWLDGKENVLTDVAANQIISVDYKNAVVGSNNPYGLVSDNIFFKNTTTELAIDYVAKENDFDDFDREFLIPFELSNMGPGISVGDINGDGLDDFFIGGPKDQSGVIYQQTASGKFEKSNAYAAIGNDKVSEDMGSLLFDADGDGDKDLYVVSGGSDFPKDDPLLQDRLYINEGGKFSLKQDALPTMINSGSCVIGSDYDKDGDMDLFIGGRVIPGNYPTPAKSCLLQNNGKGTFTDITETAAPELKNAGLICSAIWTDINNDGDQDLMLAGEWMPITVYENNSGKFTNITKQAGLAESTGSWNSITAGDFDNDGDMDYVAGNFGINLKYKPENGKPLELFYDDYDKNGINDMILCYWQNEHLYPVKTRERMIEQIPEIATIFPNWDTYGRAEIWDFYGKKRMEQSKYHFTANTYYTSYIENKGNNQFEVRKLNTELQLSTVFGIVPMDLNNDGNLDFVVHGNWYEMAIETNIQDASIGYVMLGNGDGTFKAIHPRFSGFYSPLNAKALAMISIGKNNTPALLTSNANDKMEAFTLVSGAKTIKLNDDDIAAEITMSNGKKRRHEFQAGAGYLSQNTKLLTITNDMIGITVYDASGAGRNISLSNLAFK